MFIEGSLFPAAETATVGSRLSDLRHSFNLVDRPRHPTEPRSSPPRLQLRGSVHFSSDSSIVATGQRVFKNEHERRLQTPIRPFMIHSYPSIYTLGHSAIADLTKQEVIVEEKIDGSQISFMRDSEGTLLCRSKGAQLNMSDPEGMFRQAVAYLQSIQDRIPKEAVFRGEYLAKPKHNILAYDRIPANHIIIFDINDGLESYLSPEAKTQLASSLDLETVPVLFRGILESADHLKELLEKDSCLGATKIEGVVIKPAKYDLFGRDKKVQMGKFVSEAFKEVHQKTWKQEHGNPTQKDILGLIALNYATHARWQKAIIHLREQGKITDTPKDIGPIMSEIAPDVLKECEEEIKQKLFAWAWPQLRRMLAAGFPQWYKEQLAQKQFDLTTPDS